MVNVKSIFKSKINMLEKDPEDLKIMINNTNANYNCINNHDRTLKVTNINEEVLFNLIEKWIGINDIPIKYLYSLFKISNNEFIIKV